MPHSLPNTSRCQERRPSLPPRPARARNQRQHLSLARRSRAHRLPALRIRNYSKATPSYTYVRADDLAAGETSQGARPPQDGPARVGAVQQPFPTPPQGLTTLECQTQPSGTRPESLKRRLLRKRTDARRERNTKVARQPPERSDSPPKRGSFSPVRSSAPLRRRGRSPRGNRRGFHPKLHWKGAGGSARRDCDRRIADKSKEDGGKEGTKRDARRARRRIDGDQKRDWREARRKKARAEEWRRRAVAVQRKTHQLAHPVHSSSVELGGFLTTSSR